MDLLLVEDDDILADTLSAELRDCGHEVMIAHDGREALAIVGDRPLDAIILDRMLPKLDGLSVLRQLREEEMSIPVIMLTALGQSADKVEGLEQGADDYIVKPVDIAELNARLGAIGRRREWKTSEGDTISAGEIVLSPSRHRAWYKNTPLYLSKIEFGLLAELVRNADRVLSRAMLYERVWNYDFVPKANIADMYIRRLRLKLMAVDEADPIVTIRGVGYMLRG